MMEARIEGRKGGEKQGRLLGGKVIVSREGWSPAEPGTCSINAHTQTHTSARMGHFLKSENSPTSSVAH